MSRISHLVVAGAVVLGAVSLIPRAFADDDEDTYEIDFYDHAGESGKVLLDGQVVCSLDVDGDCSRELKKTSGHHTAVFKSSAGHKVSASFDAETCQEDMCINFDIEKDHVDITCNGLCF